MGQNLVWVGQARVWVPGLLARTATENDIASHVRVISPSVRPSVCLSVRLFPFGLLNELTFDLNFACVRVMTIARRGLKVKVIGQCQRLGLALKTKKNKIRVLHEYTAASYHVSID